MGRVSVEPAIRSVTWRPDGFDPVTFRVRSFGLYEALLWNQLETEIGRPTGPVPKALLLRVRMIAEMIEEIGGLDERDEAGEQKAVDSRPSLEFKERFLQQHPGAFVFLREELLNERIQRAALGEGSSDGSAPDSPIRPSSVGKEETTEANPTDVVTSLG